MKNSDDIRLYGEQNRNIEIMYGDGRKLTNTFCPCSIHAAGHPNLDRSTFYGVCISRNGKWKTKPHNTKSNLICEVPGTYPTPCRAMEENVVCALMRGLYPDKAQEKPTGLNCHVVM